MANWRPSGEQTVISWPFLSIPKSAEEVFLNAASSRMPVLFASMLGRPGAGALAKSPSDGFPATHERKISSSAWVPWQAGNLPLFEQGGLEAQDRRAIGANG
jgi:hypothetical protein